MKKRRTFDLDLPEEEVFPVGKEVPMRRSPMAAAITENADSLRERQAIEASIRAENDRLAAEHVRMKGLGLIVDLIPLDQVETDKLARDRAPGDDAELEELVASLRDLGLSNPIRVEQREDGRYELIQGYRRLSAYRQLLAETGDHDAWGKIPAGILPRGEELDGLYRRMVDENMVRKDISFAEMAQLAITYSADQGTKENDPDRAVAELFRSAGYQKRSYIRQFIRLMQHLGDDLRFAPQIPRALGLRLVSLIEARPALVSEIKAALRADLDAAEELAVLRDFAGQPDEERPGKAVSTVPALPVEDKAKTTFQVKSKLGQAKCTAANGRLEVRLRRDFSTLDRRKLEAGLQRLLDDLAD